MKRPITYIVTTIAILFTGFAGYEFNRKLNAVNRKVNSLKQVIDSTSQSMGSINQKIDSTGQKVDSLTQQINSLTREVNAVTLKIASSAHADNKLRGRHSKIPSQPNNFIKRKMQSFLAMHA